VDDNKKLVRRFMEDALNKKNLSLLKELCAPNYTWHGEASPTSRNDVIGLEAFTRSVAEFTDAMPDLRIAIEDMIAEGDRIAVRYTESGTHTGATFLGLPPTGKYLAWSVISIFRVENGKLAEEWFNEDALGVWKQLGLLK